MIRLAVRCRPELAGAVLTELLALSPGGVEEASGDGYVELAVYGPPGELPELPDLEARVGGDLIEVTATEIPADWADRWRDFHRPVAVAGGRLVIRPSWLETDGDPEIEVVVDPGQAFGTGAHATTRLCLELLAELAATGRAGGDLIDLGTGSGVLAIAAAKLGWEPVVGCDSERAALEAARANAAANGAAVELRRLDLRREPAPAATTVVANLTAPLLVEVAARLAAPPRVLLCSGLLAAEIDRVAAAFAAAGLEAVDKRRMGDWAALALAPAGSDGPSG